MNFAGDARSSEIRATVLEAGVAVSAFHWSSSRIVLVHHEVRVVGGLSRRGALVDGQDVSFAPSISAAT
jgi:hypothetical protein